MTANVLSPKPPKIIAPPFTLETATQKVRLAEDAWNSRDPNRVALAYTEDSLWRNRSEFIAGRDQIRAFLARKWARELDYRLVKALWAFTDNRIAVRFQYEWHDDAGQWYRSYGNEQWEFDERGLMRRREEIPGGSDSRAGAILPGNQGARVRPEHRNERDLLSSDPGHDLQ